MCIDHYPPRQIIESGKEPTGTSVEVVKAVVREAGLTLTFSPNTPFSRCLRQLQHGTSDLMAGLIRTPERESFLELISYSNESSKRLFSLKTLNKDIIQRNDLQGLSVATVRGFEYPPEFVSVRNTLSVTELGSVEKAFEMVLLGRADVVIVTDYIGIQLSNQPRYENRFRMQPMKMSTADNVYIGISKKSSAVEHVSSLKQAVQKLLSNGTIKALLDEVRLKQ